MCSTSFARTEELLIILQCFWAIEMVMVGVLSFCIGLESCRSYDKAVKTQKTITILAYGLARMKNVFPQLSMWSLGSQFLTCILGLSPYLPATAISVHFYCCESDIGLFSCGYLFGGEKTQP